MVKSDYAAAQQKRRKSAKITINMGERKQEGQSLRVARHTPRPPNFYIVYLYIPDPRSYSHFSQPEFMRVAVAPSVCLSVRLSVCA